MLHASKLMAFLRTADSRRARHFYQNVLGLEFVADEPFALVFDSNGVTVRVTKVEALAADSNTVLGWSVADISSMVHSLRSEGVAFERIPGLQQDELGVWVSPGGAQVAWFKDPDGNVLSLTQFAEHAI
jgi:catechol 2,3-dioxygenase-like lactoylglutathione lyase family enzyme